MSFMFKFKEDVKVDAYASEEYFKFVSDHVKNNKIFIGDYESDSLIFVSDKAYSKDFEFDISMVEKIEQPMPLEEWLEDYCGQQNIDVEYNLLAMKDCHEWTIENENLKHKPKLTWEELFDKEYPPESVGGKDKQFRLDFRDICQLWDRNRGF